MTPMFLVIALMAVGVILILIEVLVIPGFGVIGVLGGIGMVAAVWVAYHEVSAGYGTITLLGALGASGVMVWVLPKTSAGKAMVLKTAITGKAAPPGLALLEGRTGIVLTNLRPQGSVEIDDRSVDVVTECGYVEKGTKVRVVRVEGVRVVVEPLS